MDSCPECSFMPLCPMCPGTHYLTGQFKAARNVKHCPNPPKFLLVHTKADLRHSDVNDLAYILPVNDMKAVWFPLPSLWMVNINSVSLAFSQASSRVWKWKQPVLSSERHDSFTAKPALSCSQFFLIFLQLKQKALLTLFLPSSSFQNIFTCKEETCLQLEWEWKRNNLNTSGRSCWREMGK